MLDAPSRVQSRLENGTSIRCVHNTYMYIYIYTYVLNTCTTVAAGRERFPRCPRDSATTVPNNNIIISASKTRVKPLRSNDEPTEVPETAPLFPVRRLFVVRTRVVFENDNRSPIKCSVAVRRRSGRCLERASSVSLEIVLKNRCRSMPLRTAGYRRA